MERQRTKSKANPSNGNEKARATADPFGMTTRKAKAANEFLRDDNEGGKDGGRFLRVVTILRVFS